MGFRGASHLVGGFGVANDDFTRMQAHPDELLSLVKQFTGKRYGEIGSIPNLLLLSPASQYQDLSSRVLNLELIHNGGSIVCHKQLVQVIDNHLIHSYIKKTS
jgi:hypothetical protein